MPWKRQLAKVLALVFDPLVVVPLSFLGLVGLVYRQLGSWLLPLLLVTVGLVMPGLAFLWFMAQRRFRDYEIHRRQQRLPLLFINVICQGMSVFLVWWWGINEVKLWLLTLWLITGVFFLISWVWKISYHTTMNSWWVTLAVGYWGLNYWWLYGIVGVVAWARVKDHDHTLSQTIAGALLPPMIAAIVWIYGRGLG